MAPTAAGNVPGSATCSALTDDPEAGPITAISRPADGRASFPEFHPGLLNSALRIEAQQAMDLVGAMPGAPALQRFCRIDVGVKLDPVDDRALCDMRAGLSATQARLEAECSELRRKMDAERAAARQRMDETTARFRERSAAASASLRQPAADEVESATGSPTPVRKDGGSQPPPDH